MEVTNPKQVTQRPAETGRRRFLGLGISGVGPPLLASPLLRPLTWAPARPLLPRLAALPATPAGARRSAVPDSLLWHRDGRSVRLRSDVWRGHRALISFVFTSCSSFCGLQSAMLAALQTRLAPRLGRDVVLISLSIDPLHDDPAALQTFASNFEPGPHWWWLTGRADVVFATLDALGVASGGNPADHGPLWLAGIVDEPRRIVGMPTMAQLEQALA